MLRGEEESEEEEEEEEESEDEEAPTVVDGDLLNIHENSKDWEKELHALSTHDDGINEEDEEDDRDELQDEEGGSVNGKVNKRRKRKNKAESAANTDESATSSDHSHNVIQPGSSFGVNVSSIWKKRKYRGKGRTGLTFGKNLPEGVQQDIGSASEAYLAGDYDTAIDLFKNIIEKAPNHPFPYYTNALIKEELGDLKGALTLYAVAAELTPTNVELWTKVADIAEEFGYKDIALLAVCKAFRKSKDLELEIRRVFLYVEANQIYRSEANFKKLLTKHPDMSDLLLEYANLCMLQNFDKYAVSAAFAYISSLVENPTYSNLVEQCRLSDYLQQIHLFHHKPQKEIGNLTHDQLENLFVCVKLVYGEYFTKFLAGEKDDHQQLLNYIFSIIQSSGSVGNLPVLLQLSYYIHVLVVQQQESLEGLKGIRSILAIIQKQPEEFEETFSPEDWKYFILLQCLYINYLSSVGMLSEANKLSKLLESSRDAMAFAGSDLIAQLFVLRANICRSLKDDESALKYWLEAINCVPHNASLLLQFTKYCKERDDHVISQAQSILSAHLTALVDELEHNSKYLELYDDLVQYIGDDLVSAVESGNVHAVSEPVKDNVANIDNGDGNVEPTKSISRLCEQRIVEEHAKIIKFSKEAIINEIKAAMEWANMSLSSSSDGKDYFTVYFAILDTYSRRTYGKVKPIDCLVTIADIRRDMKNCNFEPRDWMTSMQINIYKLISIFCILGQVRKTLTREEIGSIRRNVAVEFKKHESFVQSEGDEKILEKFITSTKRRPTKQDISVGGDNDENMVVQEEEFHEYPSGVASDEKLEHTVNLLFRHNGLQASSENDEFNALLNSFLENKNDIFLANQLADFWNSSHNLKLISLTPLLREFPDDAVLLLKQGHQYFSRKKYLKCLECYLKSYVLDSKQAVTSLCLSGVLLTLCTIPCHFRKDVFIKAFAFLLNYSALRLKHSAEGNEAKHAALEQEVYFNNAKFFRIAFFCNVAEACLLKALALADKTKNGPIQELSYTSQVAYELIQIYKESKNDAAAMHVMLKYLVYS